MQTSPPRRRPIPAGTIDVLAFPPDAATLNRWRAADLARASELGRRARIALFTSTGLFLAWVADVGATFHHPNGSEFYGVVSVVLALVIVVSHLGGRWLMERSLRARRAVERRHSLVRAVDAGGLTALAEQDAVVAQYLRLVGRQRRPLRMLERAALERWAAGSTEPTKAARTLR